MSKNQTAGPITREQLAQLDQEDPLASFRDQFQLPADTIYMDGNSLGALPKSTMERLETVVRQEWGNGLIRSWNAAGWIHLPIQLGEKIARLIGVAANEVAVADSTSINLFKLIAAALQLNPNRRVIVSEHGNFPSDLYMIQGLVDFAGGKYELRTVELEDLESAITDDVAIVSLTHVNYKTSRRHDMMQMTQLAQSRGALMLWDLAHSAGSMPIALNECNVDLAVGCGYKFLNGGPGAPAFAYVAQRHQKHAKQPLTGWLGHASPFDFDPQYKPAEGITRFLCGTPAILSMSALDASIDVILKADMQEVRKKSVQLGELFLALLKQECPNFFEVACPLDADQRGSQIGLSHPHGYAIVQALIAQGVLPDFRTPDILRFGLTPLYQRYVDIFDAIAVLRKIMENDLWRAPEYQRRATVT